MNITEQLISNATVLFDLAKGDQDKYREYRTAFLRELNRDSKIDKRITKQVIADVCAALRTSDEKMFRVMQKQNKITKGVKFRR